VPSPLGPRGGTAVCAGSFLFLSPFTTARRGAAKKTDAPPPPLPRTFAKSQTHSPTCRLFFLGFFLVRFWAFLGKGSSKTPLHIFLYKNTMSKTFSKQIDQNVGVNFSSTLFCFIAFSGVSQRWEFKSTTKNVLPKNCVEKFLQKIDKNPKPFCFRQKISRSWAFLGGGSSKTPFFFLMTLVLFWPLTHPPTTGVTDLFWRPLAARRARR
jgi:hypothetical protein